MPPKLLFDISNIDLDKVLFGPEEIRKYNPQRGHMEHLTAVSYVNDETGDMAGYKDVRDDEFWVAGHIPGRPLLPGVIMIEAAAQLSAYFTMKYLGWKGFLGFGGVSDVRFRMQVPPGVRLYLLAKRQWVRHGRTSSLVQGLVNGNLAFEASVTGVILEPQDSAK